MKQHPCPSKPSQQLESRRQSSCLSAEPRQILLELHLSAHIALMEAFRLFFASEFILHYQLLPPDGEILLLNTPPPCREETYGSLLHSH